MASRYDRRSARLVVTLGNEVQLAVPVAGLEGLAEAAERDLAEIEISPAGLGLHWPRLDADVYVPAPLQGGLVRKPGWRRSWGRLAGAKNRLGKRGAAGEWG